MTLFRAALAVGMILVFSSLSWADDPCEGYPASARSLFTTAMPLWDHMTPGGHFEVSNSISSQVPDDSHVTYHFAVSYVLNGETISNGAADVVSEVTGPSLELNSVHDAGGGALFVQYAFGATGRIRCGYVGLSKGGELNVLDFGGREITDIDGDGRDELVSFELVASLGECTSDMASWPGWQTIENVDEETGTLLDVSSRFPAFYRDLAGRIQTLLDERMNRSSLSDQCHADFVTVINKARMLAQMSLLPMPTSTPGVNREPNAQTPSSASASPPPAAGLSPAADQLAHFIGVLIVIGIIGAVMAKSIASGYRGSVGGGGGTSRGGGYGGGAGSPEGRGERSSRSAAFGARGFDDSVEGSTLGSSHRERTFFGNLRKDDTGRPIESTFDPNGQKIADTRREATFFGNERVDDTGRATRFHRDDKGNRIGETRQETTFFGNTRKDDSGAPIQYHRDENGERVGETRHKTDFFGDVKKDDAGRPIEYHYDKNGKEIGESHFETDFFGNIKKDSHGDPIKVTKMKDDSS